MPIEISAAFPQEVPSFSQKFDLTDVVFAEHINQLQREVEALASTLGTLPAGLGASNVRERMEAIEATIADISDRFTPTKTFPQTAVEGLDTSLSALTVQIAALQTAVNSLGSQVSAMSTAKPEAAQVVLLTGQQYIYGLKLFQGLVRLLATQRHSPVSTNHAWEIGVSGGRVIKFDYMGWGAYDGINPADLELQTAGGNVFFGGDLRAIGMAGVAAELAGPRSTSSGAYTTVADSPAVTLKVPSSGRVSVHLAAEIEGTYGGRMGVQLSGANTLAAADLRSIVGKTGGTVHRTLFLGGLAPGNTTFTARQKAVNNTASFTNLSLVVVPLL